MNLERVNRAIAQMSKLREEVDCDCCFDNKYGWILEFMIRGILVELDIDDDNEGVNFGMILDAVYNGGEVTEMVVHALGGEIEEDCTCGAYKKCICANDDINLGDRINILYDDEYENMEPLTEEDKIYIHSLHQSDNFIVALNKLIKQSKRNGYIG